MLEGVISWIEAVESSEVSADPENAVPIFVNNSDPSHHSDCWGRWIVLVRLKTVSIVAIQSHVGTKPKEAVVILRDALNLDLKQFPSYGELGEQDILLIHDRKLHYTGVKSR